MTAKTGHVLCARCRHTQPVTDLTIKQSLSCRFEALHLRVWILGGAQEEISGFEAQILTDSADQV